MNDAVLVDVADGVLVATINRPRVRNAVNRAVAEGLAAAMDRLDADPRLRAGIITGAGGFFCAGMDLTAFGAGERPTVEGRGFAGLVERPPATPLIAAVEGPALGGGTEIVLTCDLVVAAGSAVFGLPEVKRGLIAAGGGLLRLPGRVPYHRAMEIALLGERFTAADAHGFGMVNRLVADGAALATARELAARIAANGPLAVAATKQVLTAGWAADAEGFAGQAGPAQRVRESADAAEGARAFVEKRAPRWVGR
ncbi:enoyl CoA dehydratase/isomerase [Pseudonocardia sulfidoxydans NBRC 16205]|uniref:Enoyl CoA dehydratase/isomerase n=1 Tax=Pseudonocardia sulfidoxydans NBRC 16205 TaxID=1223511 RepID=A0A511DBW1_9PSEU|nr:crotonase/enoyl-CoA hydratase family protein [Pseudonocardia sulfidoxydans]GEL22285.1 enoyl CoA dehydratase/isomerase [Pseudonocardia sulfidoxydans NBRC 16205]